MKNSKKIFKKEVKFRHKYHNEVIVVDKITLCGNVEYAQYLTLKEQKYYILAKSIEDANTLNIRVDGKDFTLMREDSLPVVNIGDEVEVTGMSNSHGWIEITTLNNRTIKKELEFSCSDNYL